MCLQPRARAIKFTPCFILSKGVVGKLFRSLTKEEKQIYLKNGTEFRIDTVVVEKTNILKYVSRVIRRRNEIKYFVAS